MVKKKWLLISLIVITGCSEKTADNKISIASASSTVSASSSTPAFVRAPRATYKEMRCDETEMDETVKKDLIVIDEKQAIQANEPLFENGKLKCEVSFDYKTNRNNIRRRSETGVLKEVKYKIFFDDGSARVQGLPTNTLDYIKDPYDSNWSVMCKVDEIDDTSICALNRDDLHIAIWKDGSTVISLGGDTAAGSQVVIRVDKNQPITSSIDVYFNESQTQDIIKQLQQGSTVVTRYRKWADGPDIDKSTNLFGFSQAYNILQKIHASM